MESCPMCLRPLYTDYDDADIGRTQDGAFHASPVGLGNGRGTGVRLPS